MLKKRIISSSIFTDLDYLDEYVKLQFETNKKIKKKVEITTNINIYNKKLLFFKKKTITKTDKKLFIRKLEMDSIDILYQVVNDNVNKIFHKFGRFILYLYRPTSNYKKYPHLSIRTLERLKKIKKIPRVVVLGVSGI
tara:strand:+ start:1469 stop:1882 length:414 start_codon:yes stop_codon:yes gene_type:complete